MKKIIVLIFVVGAFSIRAQHIVVVQEKAIQELLQKHSKITAKIGYISGFRVQLFFDSGNNSKSNAESTKLKFSAQYPQVPAYLLYKEPNFKVRVGDFRSRTEARGFLKKILPEYPSAFVIKDEIKLPILKESEEKTE